MSIVLRLSLLVTAAILVWRIVTAGIGDFFASEIASTDPSSSVSALAWAGARPETLERQAALTRTEDPERAMELYQSAYVRNPGRAEPLMNVAEGTKGLWVPELVQTAESDLAEVDNSTVESADSVAFSEYLSDAGSTDSAGSAQQVEQGTTVAVTEQTDISNVAGVSKEMEGSSSSEGAAALATAEQSTGTSKGESAAKIEVAVNAADTTDRSIAQSSETPGVVESRVADTSGAGIPGDVEPVPAPLSAETIRSDLLAREAVRLEPANPDIRIRAAAYWVHRGDLDNALAEWSAALDANPSRFDQLFPVLLKLVEHPSTRGALTPYAAQPPTWWDRFFGGMAARALELDTVRYVYSQRRENAAVPISLAERQAYIARLQKEGRSTEAYLTWVNGLSELEREHLGLVYNGGFELALTDTGFDWHIGQSRGEKIETAATYGTEGDRALHLVFSNMQEPFRRFYQPLFIDPGRYRVTGQVRTDGLKTNGGLQWSVECRVEDKTFSAGTSERFLGSQQWRVFEFELELPPGCADPTLRLSTYARVQSDYRISGGAWFDDLRMRRLAPEIPAEEIPVEGQNVTENAAAKTQQQ